MCGATSENVDAKVRVASSDRPSPTGSSLYYLTGTTSLLFAQQALLDLAPREQLEWFYFLVMNASVPLFEPRVLQHSFLLFTA